MHANFWINTASSVAPDPSLTGFDLRLALRFSQKSVSEDTRRAYHRVVHEFFSFTGNIHPTQVTPELILRFRDQQLTKRKRAVTVAFKLAVIRSFFEYLRAAGMVRLNPASAKLVPVPQVDQGGTGRALTAREVSHLLAGPDRKTSDGARDYAIMFMMLRTSLRVSEVYSLKESSVKWSHGRWAIRFKVKGEGNGHCRCLLM
jgi:integrase/recombinase XerD